MDKEFNLAEDKAAGDDVFQIQRPRIKIVRTQQLNMKFKLVMRMTCLKLMQTSGVVTVKRSELDFEDME